MAWATNEGGGGAVLNGWPLPSTIPPAPPPGFVIPPTIPPALPPGYAPPPAVTGGPQGPGSTSGQPVFHPGTHPDYKTLIKGTPEYQAWQASVLARLGPLSAARQAAVRALALKYGALPPGFKDAYGDLTPEDLAADSNNEFSVTKELARALTAATKGIAARGMLDSGERGFVQENNARDTQNAMSDFLAALNDAVNTYATGEANIYGEEPNIIADIMPGLQEQYPETPDTWDTGPTSSAGATTAPTTFTPPSWSTTVPPATIASILKKVAGYGKVPLDTVGVGGHGGY